MQTILKEPIYPIYIRSGGTWPKKSFMMYKKNIFIKTLAPIEYGLTKRKMKTKLKNAYEELDKK